MRGLHHEKWRGEEGESVAAHLGSRFLRPFLPFHVILVTLVTPCSRVPCALPMEVDRADRPDRADRAEDVVGRAPDSPGTTRASPSLVRFCMISDTG